MNRTSPIKTKKILITGGAGYIGSHVNKKLSQYGYDTVVIDNLSRGNRKTVCYGTFFEGDVGSSADLKRLFDTHQFDGIMHFAASTDVGESVSQPHIYYKNNICNTINLLDFAVRFGVKAFVFSSSAAIFGIPTTPSIDETHPCAPINPYGQTKYMVEKILADYDLAYGLKSCCLRYFNAAGGDPDREIPLPERKENNLIPLLLDHIRSNKNKITIFGADYPTPDGTCIRDYIHVADLADAHLKGLNHLFLTNKSSAYNLGNGNGFSVREVIAATEQVTGTKLHPILGERRPGDPSTLIANPKKAERELDWHPHHSNLELMIRDAFFAFR